MPTLHLMSLKEAEKLTKSYPIALIKGDERNKLFNHFLIVDPDGKEKNKQRIELPHDLVFQLLPPDNPKKRSIWYIAGAAGSGKSYQAKIVINNYHKLFPKNPVYLISKLTSDETLDELKFIQRIDITQFSEEGFDINEQEPSLIIFDDFETLEKKELDVVLKAIDDIAIMGRHHQVSMIYISHHLTNYKQTRLILNESHNIVIFPQSSSNYQLRYLLQNYGNMDKESVKPLNKLGRWCCIHTQYPNYVISQNSAYLLHQDD
jgi:Cdc6-like AAA superfamily ATPase